MKPLKKGGLGRGLDTLLSNHITQIVQQPTTVVEGLAHIPIDQLKPSPYQPRQNINEDSLKELAQSIKSQGIIQPIVVRQHSNHYEIIAGERRWRACQILAMKTVPVITKNVSDKAVVALALIENIQREALNPIEEARAYEQLHQKYDMSHEQIADTVGKSRSAVTNTLRLLQLIPEIQQWLAGKQLEMGHARSLIPLEKEKQLLYAQYVIDKKLNVRATERLVQQRGLTRGEKPKGDVVLDAELQAILRDLQSKLPLRVSIQPGRNERGKLIINYENKQSLKQLIEKVQ